MTMFSKVMLVAALWPGESGHVLILMPFIVPVMLQSLTTRPLTSPSFGYLPKLPTLDTNTRHTMLYQILWNIYIIKKEKKIRQLWKCQCLPDAMARSTTDACDSDLGISLSNRNAIITSANEWSRKINRRASFNMDSISIRTVCWGKNINSTPFEVFAFYKSYVKELAIQWRYASKNCFVHCHKLQILKEEYFS